MPWSALKEKLPDAVKNKSLELRQLFVKVANAILEETGNETKAIQAGIAAVLSEENKKKKLAKAALDLQKKTKAEELSNYKPPAHLAALIQAANLKKQAVLDQQELERKKLQDIKDSILLQVKSDTAKSIVDMQVQGEDVLLIHKDGTKVKRKLADYTINQQVVVSAAQEPTFTNPNPSLGVGGIPSGSTFENQNLQQMFDQLLYPFSVVLAASPNLVEIGTVLSSINLSWNSSIPDANFELNQGIGDVTGSTSYAYSDPVSTNTTFTLTAVSGGMTRVSNAQVSFKNRIITAPTANTLPDEAELLAAGGILSDSFVRTATYDCTGGRRPYIAYPTRLGVMNVVTVNNLIWTDYTTTTVSHTNASGYTEDYYVLVSNNILYGSSVTIKWGG